MATTARDLTITGEGGTWKDFYNRKQIVKESEPNLANSAKNALNGWVICD